MAYKKGFIKIQGWAHDGLTDEQIAINIGIRRQGLLENLDSAHQYAETEKPQSQQGLFQSTIDKTAADVQKDYNSGNVML